MIFQVKKASNILSQKNRPKDVHYIIVARNLQEDQFSSVLKKLAVWLGLRWQLLFLFEVHGVNEALIPALYSNLLHQDPKEWIYWFS
jgi:hypothetical protein